MTEAVAKTRSECVGCDFAIFSDGLDLENLVGRLGINADWLLPPVAATLDSKGVARNCGRRGCWLVRSNGRVVSEDVNEHLRYLLAILQPHRETIIAAAKGGVATFTVNWSGPTYPYHCGPTLAVDCVAGIADLEAEITFTLHVGQQAGA